MGRWVTGEEGQEWGRILAQEAAVTLLLGVI